MSKQIIAQLQRIPNNIGTGVSRHIYLMKVITQISQYSDFKRTLIFKIELSAFNVKVTVLASSYYYENSPLRILIKHFFLFLLNDYSRITNKTCVEGDSEQQ